MVRFFVASFGYKKVVQHLLDFHDLSRHVEAILTPASVRMPEGVVQENKNLLLAYATLRYSVSNPVLVDYRVSCVDAARRAGYGAYHVYHPCGLTTSDVVKLQTFSRGKRVDAICLGIDNVLFQGHVIPQYIYNLLVESSVYDPPNVQLSPGVKTLFYKK